MAEADVLTYYEAATVLDAREKLFVINSLDYQQNMPSEKRKSLVKDLSNVAYPREKEDALTSSELAEQMASLFS